MPPRAQTQRGTIMNAKPRTSPVTTMHAAIASLDKALIEVAVKTPDAPDAASEHSRWRARAVASTARFTHAMTRLQRRR